MKGMEMPIKIIMILVIIALVALVLIGFFSKAFGESGDVMGSEALKSSACLKWCNSNAEADKIKVVGTTNASVVCGDFGDASCVAVCNCGRQSN